MSKEVILELDDKLYLKLEKQFNEFGVGFDEGIKIVLSTFVDESEGFVVREKTPTKKEKAIICSGELQMSKSIAKSLFEKCGYMINKPYTYASRGDIGKTNYDFYWANPNFDCLTSDWCIVLHDKYIKQLTLLKIPKNTFSLETLRRRPDKDVIDLRIECDGCNFRDIASNNYFKNYFIATIDYFDMGNPKVIE